MPEDFTARVIREFRENDGRVGPPFEGANLILIHHVGARSGTERVTPLVYYPDGDDVVIVASAAAAPKHPAWFHNLMAHPRLTVEVATPDGAQTREVDAEQLTGAERDAMYARIVEVMPFFGEYEVKTAGIRTIPLVRLRPAA